MSLLACQTTTTDVSTPGALRGVESMKVPELSAATYAAHGELLERRGDLTRAVEQYRRALELQPDMVTVRSRLGVTLNRLGRHAEATTEFRRALVKASNEAYLHNNLGFSLYLQERYIEAEHELVRALELQPDFRRARMNRALVLARMGRYEPALTEFCEAGSEADAYYNVAVIQAEAGRYADAASSLERALELNPQLEVARTHLRQIARLAAAEEAAKIAAAEAEKARLERTQTEAEAEALAAADMTAAETFAGPPVDVPDYDWDRAARLFDLMHRAIAAAREASPFPDTERVFTIAEARLTQMFDNLIIAMNSGSPGYEACLADMENILDIDLVQN